ncbi:TetR/AcrR family transcriptional regulator [Nocardia stercoris]|uniref:TetR/AcrR family transcriptional regulator n=1 Tax=Nocardia stercoris TaxID=2483361 RepID=UPI001F2C6F97|nr:TetR/AcrR family transcriptional regulator [Nocardia stercoris]
MKPALSRAADRAGAPDDLVERILDGAFAQFEQVGVKKTTIEDIAQRAGVDRVTVYRRVGSRDDVVQAVVGREIAAVLTELAAIPDRHDTLDDVVADMFVTVITRWRTNPLVARLLTVEPFRVIGKLTVEGETSFGMAVAATAAAIERCADRGLLSLPDDLLIRAEVVCRVVHSWVLAPYGAVAAGNAEELADFARKFLVPVVRP